MSLPGTDVRRPRKTTSSAVQTETGDFRIDPPYSSRERRKRSYQISAWIALLGTGLALRLIAIDSRGLWSDEAWRVWAARLPSVLDVLHVAWAQPPSAPLYWLGLHFWIELFGHGDVAVRLFSVIPSVANIPAIFGLGRLLAGSRAGWIAAILLTVAPMAVEIGQEATMYAWTMLVATLALAAGWLWLQAGKGGARYLACGALLVYLHYLGPLLLAWFFLAGLLACRESGRRGFASHLSPGTWIRGHALLALIWLPWAFAMSGRIADRWPELRQLRHLVGWNDLYRAAAHLVLSASPQSFWPPMLVVALVAGGGLFLAWTCQRARPRSAVLLCALIAFGTVSTLLGTSALTKAWLFQPRFLTLVLPLLLSMSALGLAAPSAGRNQRAVLVGLACFWLGVQIAGLSTFYARPVHGRDGMREIGAWLTAAVAPGDVVVGNHPLLLWSVAQYYSGRLQGLPTDWDVRRGYPLLPPSQPAWVQAQQAAVASVVGAAPRLWVLYLPTVDPDRALLASIQKCYRPAATRTYPLLTVYLFTKRVP